MLKSSGYIFVGCFFTFFTMSCIFSAGTAYGGQNLREAVGGVDASELVHQVIQNELAAQTHDQSLWQYRERSQKDGKVSLSQVVETRDGDIHRLLSVNDRPLPAEQRRNEDLRIKDLVQDPQKFKEIQKSRKEDAQKERALLKQLSEAFCYQYDGKEGNLIRLRFSPNPNFHPSGREGQVFHHMSGFMLVDPGDKRLAALTGRLANEVKFGFGLLGHLDQGGTFSVKQQEVGPGHWAMTSLNVEMNGKVLFFKTIDVREKETEFNFEMLPSTITLEKAAELLERNPASQSASRE
jgi:hypothetical protein